MNQKQDLSALIPLVPRSIDGHITIETVNARNIHSFLGVGRDFSTWIRDRIEQFGFLEEVDFHIVRNLSTPETGSAKARPQSTVDYFITTGMAKELGMVERNDKGREIRQYFIECEKKLKAILLPQTYAEALRELADTSELAEQRRLQLEEQKPAVEFLDRFVEAKSNKNFREVAKILGVKEREFIKSLENDKIVFRQSGNLLPFAHYQHAGWFTVKTGEANGRAIVQTRFTPSGIAWIAKRYANE